MLRPYRLRMYTGLTFSVMLLTAFIVLGSQARAGQVDLVWDAPKTNTDGIPLTDVVQYRVYYRQENWTLPKSVEVGTQTTYTLGNLADGESYSVTVTAINTAGNESAFSDKIFVTATSSNDPPVAVIDSVTILEVTPVTFSVLANDSDVDGDTLTVATVTQGSNGSVVINADNTRTYTPVAKFHGSDTFSHTAHDGNGGTATGTVAVSVTTGFVMIWVEAEDGSLTPPMEVGFDDMASFGQYVWVPEGHGTLLDPSQEGGVAQYTFAVPEADTYVIWGNILPGAAGTGSFFIAVDGEEQGGGAAGDNTVTEVSSQTYEVTSLQVGDLYYLDRSYTITAMPAELEGLTAIKTANDDKHNQDATFLTFTATQDATIYVAYDARATRYPNWLTASFTNTGLLIDTSDVSLTVWQQDVPAGLVSLPGNKYGEPVGVGSMYVVLVAFHGQEAPPPDIRQVWLWDQAARDTSPVFFLEAGVHTLTIKQRESGTKLDQILITNDMELTVRPFFSEF